MNDMSDHDIENIILHLSKALNYTANEARLLASMENYFCPKPAKLADSEENVQVITHRLNHLCKVFGLPMERFDIGENQGEPRPRYDTYLPAAIDETLHSFHRCRTSICRTHLFYIGAETIREHPDWLHLIPNGQEHEIAYKAASERYWEHAETSYIRLASFWDRAGQVLDFVFFNIRQYERDGFPSILQRIKTNIVPVNANIANSDAWNELWRHQKSEDTSGLKWLLHRRNLVIHSLQLRPISERINEHLITASIYNHLDESLRKRLRPGSEKQELEYLHSHLASLARLFPQIIKLCELSVHVRETKK